MNNEKYEAVVYESPELDVLIVEVEKGFAASVPGFGDGGSY